jgi:hypothetical protein
MKRLRPGTEQVRVYNSGLAFLYVASGFTPPAAWAVLTHPGRDAYSRGELTER